MDSDQLTATFADLAAIVTLLQQRIDNQDRKIEDINIDIENLHKEVRGQ